MGKKRNILVLLVLLALLALPGGCKGKEEAPGEIPVEAEGPAPEEPAVPEEEPETEVPEEVPPQEVQQEETAPQGINPLTGRRIREEAAVRRPVGVMVNNLKAAMPQSGLAQADIVYETLVEGGITRLYAVFQDFDAPKIGPVRSARHYYLDFAAEHDALYVHYGLSPQARTAIKERKAPSLNGLSYLDEILCFRDRARKAPHDKYTSQQGIMAAWEKVGYRKEPDREGKFLFSPEGPTAGAAAGRVDLGYSNYAKPWFTFDKESGTYLRFQYGAPQIDKETGGQLAYENVLVQFAGMWTIKGDAAGRMDMELTGTGQGWHISNGFAVPITWSRKSRQDPTLFFLADGRPLVMREGKTWINVFPKNRKDMVRFEP
ncbi:DUF3048 domain-containing protein [Anaerotalea alkaliphila]|uniref:DUF3048 domain-containing protein n=1 Tax=Anaerotalea alkaliphila TaxID=2662126 RepID=A0A7X5HTY1_9FIRM|nr:DUF3048 domain-containing protein [Anaerotalea alkaliphila]NDL66620.1 DUF3048 domain-containing protein [Anaerotalea alkaliphila]